MRLGVNGFGRIGRMIVRAAMEKTKQSCGPAEFPQIAAINDPFMTAEHMAYLLKYDSSHGLFHGDISVIGTCLKINGQLVETTSERDALKIPWGKACVQYVVDATGLNTKYDKAAMHLRESVKRVLVSGPSKDIPMFVVGINHDCYDNEMTVVSCASCTTNCLAPLAKVIHENFEIQSGLIMTTHAVTASQNCVDGMSKSWRKGRGAWQNIIPASTGAAAAIGKIIPELSGRLTGIAARVPIPTGSMLDLTVNLGKGRSYDILKCKVKEAADTTLKGILGYTSEQIVSSDIIGDSRSCIFDASAGIALTDCFVKLIAWYDNEWGYANRVVEMAKYMASRENCG